MPRLKLHAVFTNWMRQPIDNAADRMALARIVYGLFFLFYLSYTDIREIEPLMPLDVPFPFGWLPHSPAVLPILEPLLVFLLGLLVLGLFTRPVTVLVWLTASYWGLITHAAFGIDKLIVMMVFFTPFLGIFSHWGAVYSVDAFRAKRAPDPGSKNWVYFWPARTMIVLLAFLYFSAGYYKVVHPAGWLQDPDFLARFLQIKPMQSVVNNGTPLNPLVTWIAQYDILTVTGQYAILAFELTFPVVLISTAAYLLYMRLVPFFHFLNAVLLGIPFLPILAAYIFIFDWKNLADATPLNVDRFRQFPLKTWQALPIAALPALLWNTTPVPRFLFGGFGLFEGNRSVWYVLLPVILLWYAYNLVRYWRGRSAPHAAPAVPQAD